jgi:hypothetical protein
LGRDRRPVEAAYRLGARALGETHWERLESDSREEGSVVGRIQERYGVAKTEAEKQADEWSHALEWFERDRVAATRSLEVVRPAKGVWTDETGPSENRGSLVQVDAHGADVA